MPENDAFPFPADDVEGALNGTSLIGIFHGTTSL
jgi:hypothetical protein